RTGLVPPANRMITPLYFALTRLMRLFDELIDDGSLPAGTRLQLLRALVFKTDANASDLTLRAHWEARGADFTLVFKHPRAPTDDEWKAVQALALDKRIQFGYAEVRSENVAGTAQAVLHLSIKNEAIDRLTEPIAI